jgi:imidazolonepropionase-like amidohydrolase
MDVHTHLNIPINPYERGTPELAVTERTVARAAMHALDNARQLIGRGVTTVRDVGSHGHGIFALKEAIDQGAVPGPRVVACGRAIAMTGGHAPFVAVEADGPDAVRHQARLELKAGAGALKFMASGAGAEAGEDPRDLQLTSEEMAAGVREARARRRTTAAHAVNPEAVKNAVEAGVDSIEHGVLIDEASLLLMKVRGVHFVPTIWTYQMTAAHGQVHGTEAWVVAEVRKRVEVHLAMVSRARELGVEVATGTDSAVPVNPADSIFWEIEWLSHCGFSAVEAIQAATRSGARLLEIDDRLGTVEAGKEADLLLVEGDPVRDLRALRRTVVVMKQGAVVVSGGRAHLTPLLQDPRNPPPGPVPPGFGAP